MNSAVKIINSENNSKLTIAHMAGSTPFYYVEEAEIVGRKVEVAYFNENDPASEIEVEKIPVKDLVDFTNEFYRDYVDVFAQDNETVHQERLPVAGIDYLKDNLKAVTTDYLNQR